MRAPTLTLLPLLVACARAAAPPATAASHLDAMSREHARDTPAANDAAQAPRQEVRAEDVVYGDVEGAPARGYYARPAAESDAPRPAILVVHEWWGLNDNVRMMVRRLAGEGYQVLAVDMYGRVASTPEEARAAMGEVVARPERGVAHLRAGSAFLRDAKRAPRMGVLGWCFGGGWSLEAALTLPERVDAAVMYYGRVVGDRERLARLDAPLLGHFGGEDQGIPLAGVRAMEATLRELGRDVSVHVYEGAGHAFANPSGQRYQAEAAERAWRRTTEFFARHLGPR